MSDEHSNPGASEGNPSGSGEPAAGGPGDGGAPGTQASADAFAEERERLSKQARDFQSARDRERARAEAAERELAALKGGGNSPEPAQPSGGLTMADLVRYDQLREAKETLKSEFPDADPGIFSRALEFDSPEALRATVERSHNGRKEYRERIEREADERARAILREHGIEAPEPATPTSGTTPTGDPTPEDLNSTPVHEWEERGWTDEVVDRVLAANNTGALYRSSPVEDE